MSGDALSDLVLALVCLGCAIRLMSMRPALAVGAFVIGLAATAGVLRFSGIELALGPHRFLSLLAACAGFPLLAFAVRWPDDPIARHITAAGRFVLIAGAIGVVLTVADVTVWRDLIPALSVVAITLTALKQRHAPLLMASASLIAALVMASMGKPGAVTIGPLSHVQWLHYLMAIGLLCLYASKPVAQPRSPSH